MTTLRSWLASIDMEKYQQLLESNSVDLDVIAQLTESDLSELGITMGDRKRLLRAVRLLNHERPKDETGGFSENAPDFEGVPDRTGRLIGELRQMTIMLVDLVNSTELVQDLGVEEYRDALKAFQTCNTEAIRENFGHLSQFIGDGVVAYFGFPIANEDDAERAVMTALQIIDKVELIAVPHNQKLSVRIGIATGDVLIEDVMYGAKQADNFALGNIPNLAARLQTLAEPGQIAITGRTRRLLGRNFQCRSIGDHRLKGFSEPVGVWLVESSESTELRFEKRRHGALTPMIGRKEEFGLLKGRWKATCRGEGQAVFLSGEAGLGKSRLAEEVFQQLVLPQGRRLSFQCSPYLQNSAFYPVKSHFNHAIGTADSDTPEQLTEKLVEFLENRGGVSDEILSTFSDFLSMRQATPSDATRPEEAKARTMDALLQYIHSSAEEQPVLMLFEDLHWIDPSSEELLNLLIDRLDSQRVMVLGTYRPEYAPRWLGHPKVTTLQLPALGQRETKKLLRALDGLEETVNGLMQTIVTRSEGVPLFVEEMVSMLSRAAESGWSKDHKEQEILFPSNLKDLLRARLDHLSVAPDTVSICAALGRSFTPELVAAVADRSMRDVDADLGSLVQSQILVAQARGSESRFSFRHAMIREVAYEAILPQRAKQLHYRIAETMTKSFPHLCERHPEVLALHLRNAEQFDAARDKLQEAAALALRNYASQEAIAHLTAALDAHALLEADDTSDAIEIELRQNLAVALEIRGWGSPEIATNREKLVALNEKIGDQKKAFANFQQLISDNLIAGRPDVVWGYYERTIDLIGEHADPALWTLCEHNGGMASLLLGEFERAIMHFDRALEWRDKADLKEINRYYPADPKVIDIVMRCWAGAMISSDRATMSHELDAATAIAKAQTSKFTRCYALSIIATIYCLLDDPEQTLTFAQEAHSISDKIEFIYWEAWTSVLLGWASARCGDQDSGIDTIKAGLERYIATGSGQIIAFSHTLLADAYLSGGEVEEAAGQISKARKVMRQSAVRFHEDLTDAVAKKIAAQS